MAELACKHCRFVNVDTEVCTNCGSTELTKEWYGYVIIVNPGKSEIAKRLGIDRPGKYALQVE